VRILPCHLNSGANYTLFGGDSRYFEIELHRGLDECLIDLERQVGTIREAYAVEIGHLEVAGQARHTSTIVLSMGEFKAHSYIIKVGLVSLKFLMSLDGGGVRSYSSLMILEALMNKVYRLLISAEHPLKGNMPTKRFTSGRLETNCKFRSWSPSGCFTTGIFRLHFWL
jgi:hypothetical protein